MVYYEKKTILILVYAIMKKFHTHGFITGQQSNPHVLMDIQKTAMKNESRNWVFDESR